MEINSIEKNALQEYSKSLYLYAFIMKQRFKILFILELIVSVLFLIISTILEIKNYKYVNVGIIISMLFSYKVIYDSQKIEKLYRLFRKKANYEFLLRITNSNAKITNETSDKIYFVVQDQIKYEKSKIAKYSLQF